MQVLQPYLDKIEDDEQRQRMEEVLSWTLQTFPQLEPRIAWNQPMFADHGTFIIGFSMAKKHMAVSPEQKTIEHFAETIDETGLSRTKMLVRMPWNKPVDYDLLTKFIAFNIEDKAETTTFWRK